MVVCKERRFARNAAYMTRRYAIMAGLKRRTLALCGLLATLVLVFMPGVFAQNGAKVA
jgi:hypothetical protein